MTLSKVEIHPKMDLSTYFESLMNRSPLTTGEVGTYLKEMKRTPSGALVTSKLLATKLQCSSESGALQAFNFLETALNSESEGSIEFRTEIGRYRFLNEIIRILSPKYLGEQTPQNVKNRAISFLQDAAGPKRQKWFPSEHSKIVMVYDSLIESGIIERPASGISPEAELQKSIFDRAENAAMLKKLLSSKDPTDLEAANRLIKKLVEQETARNERRADLHSLLDRIDTSTTLLREMLSQPTVEWELVGELSSTCQNLRQKLGATPSETTEETNALLQASETIEDVLKMCEKRKAGGESNLVFVDEGGAGDAVPNVPAANFDSVGEPSSSSLTDDLLGSLGIHTIGETAIISPFHRNAGIEAENLLLNFDFEIPASNSENKPFQTGLNDGSETKGKESPRSTALGDIEKLSQELMIQSLGGGTLAAEFTAPGKKTDKLTLKQMQKNLEESKTCSTSANQMLGISGDHFGQFLTGGLQDPVHGEGSKGLIDLSFLENRGTASREKSPGPVMDEKPLDFDEKKQRIDANDSNSSDLQTSIRETVKKADHLPGTELSQIRAVDLEKIDILDSVDPIELNLANGKTNSKTCVTATVSFGRYPDFSKRVGLIVMALCNKSSKDELLNYVFQLIPPKGMHIKLLPPSCMELPPWKKSFLPPASLTQVGVIVSSELAAKDRHDASSAKFILSYCLGEETYLHDGLLTLPSCFCSSI